MKEEDSDAGIGAGPFASTRMDIPDGVEQTAAAGIEELQAGLEKLKSNAEAMTAIAEKSYSAAVRDAADLHSRMVESIRSNLLATFEFATELLAAKSMPEMIELYTKFARRQFETYTLQTKDLWSLGQKMMSDTAKPVASGFSRGIDQAASS